MSSINDSYKKEKHRKRKYYDTLLLGELLKSNYEFSNNEYEGITGSDVFDIISKPEKYTSKETLEMKKNALMYLNMKYGYPIKKDIYIQFENLDFNKCE